MTTPTAAPQADARLRRGCWAPTAWLLLLPCIALAWCEWETVVTIEPIAPGEGWVAFQRRVEYAFPADADTAVWLGRSLDARATWHQLAPTDAVRDARFTWLAPRLLRIDSSATPTAAFVRAVDDVAIEWR